MTRSSTADPAQRRVTRISGVDAARGIALLGMMTVHVLSTTDDVTGDATLAGWLFTGRPSALFALLAGVGLALLCGGAGGAGSRARTTWHRKVVGVRAVLIVIVGMAIALMETSVAIILVHYGMLFLFALPFLRMGARALFGLSAVWVVLAPPALWAVHQGFAARLDGFPDMWRLWHSPSFADVFRPEMLAMDLGVTGYYPLIIWPAYLFTGMAVGRLRLDRRVVAVRLALVGGLLAALSYLIGWITMLSSQIVPDLVSSSGQPEAMVRGELVAGTLLPIIDDTRWFGLVTPHSGSSMDVLHTVGASLLVLGVCLLVVDRLGWIAAPLVGAGAMPLTLYVGHLVVLHFWRADEGFLNRPEIGSVDVIIALTVAALVAGAVKQVLRRRGPLEALTHSSGLAAAGPRPG